MSFGWVNKPLNLTCSDCSSQFQFLVEEQNQFKANGWANPKRCSNCRNLKKGSINKNKQVYNDSNAFVNHSNRVPVNTFETVQRKVEFNPNNNSYPENNRKGNPFQKANVKIDQSISTNNRSAFQSNNPGLVSQNYNQPQGNNNKFQQPSFSQQTFQKANVKIDQSISTNNRSAFQSNNPGLVSQNYNQPQGNNNKFQQSSFSQQTNRINSNPFQKNLNSNHMNQNFNQVVTPQKNPFTQNNSITQKEFSTSTNSVFQSETFSNNNNNNNNNNNTRIASQYSNNPQRGSNPFNKKEIATMNRPITTLQDIQPVEPERLPAFTPAVPDDLPVTIHLS